jgi:hypothetical protein
VEMQIIEDSDKIPPSSQQRYQNVENWFKKRSNPISIEYIKKLTQKDLDQNGVCSHGENNGIKYGSIWSWIQDYGDQKIYLCPGVPCKNEYNEFEILMRL